MNTSANNSNLQVAISNRQILKLTLPITFALLVPQINYLTNNIFLGWLGESELGAAGITGVFYIVVAIIGFGLNSGVQAIISRRAGEKNAEEIGKTFFQAIRIALLFSAIAIVLFYFIAPVFLRASLQIQEIQDQAISFLKIRIWGLPFLYLFQLGNGLLIGTNNSRYLKYAFISEASLNILLDYTFIFGKWGFPELGFNGAAYASIISEATAMLVVFAVIFYKKFDKDFFLFTFIKFHLGLTKLILKQSVPLILQFGISVSAWLFFYIAIENTGERPLAISNAMRNIFGIVGIFCWAFASATNTMVSNIIGQGKKDKVIFLVNKIVLLSFSFTTVLCLIINLFPRMFLQIYDQQIDFVDESIPVIRMVSLGIMLMSIAIVWLNAVTGTGNSKINLYIEVIAIFLYSFFVYFAMNVWKFSLVWAWSSELLYWGTLFILAFFYMKSGKWEKKVI